MNMKKLRASEKTTFAKVAMALVALAVLLLALLLLTSCNEGGSADPSLADELRGEQTLPPADGERMYWLRSSSVCHTTPDCHFIAGKEDIICSSFAESGKLSVCKDCADLFAQTESEKEESVSDRPTEKTHP